MKPFKFLAPIACAMLIASCSSGGSSSSGSGASSSASGSTGEPSSSATGSTGSTGSTGTGSSSASTQTSTPGAGPFITEPTHIVLWSTFNDSYQTRLENFASAFAAIEPNVEVEIKKESGSYDDLKNKVIDGLAVDAFPDLFVGYPDAVQAIMQYDRVVQLDDYINHPAYGWTEEDKEDIIEVYLEEGQSYPLEGTWSFPLAKSTEVMYYNRRIIGLNLSEFDPTLNDGKPISEDYINDLTWEELFGKFCPAVVAYNNTLPDDQKLLRNNPDYTTTVFGYDSDDNLFITLAEQYGYGYTSVNQTTGKGSIDFVNPGMKNLLKQYNVYHNLANPYFFSKGTNNNNYTNYAFTAGCSLFSVGSTGGQKYQQSDLFDTGVARIPHAEGGKAAVINQGPSISILDHKDNNRALASWLFYKFMTNKQNAADWAINTGYSPIRYSTLDSEEYAEYASLEGKDEKTLEIINARVARYVAQVSEDFFVSPVFKGSDEARNQVGGLFAQVVSKAGITDDEIDSLFNEAKNNVLQKM